MADQLKRILKNINVRRKYSTDSPLTRPSLEQADKPKDASEREEELKSLETDD